MKTAKERIEEKRAMLYCVEQIIDEIKWRVKSEIEIVEAREEEIKEAINVGLEPDDYIIERKRKAEMRIEYYNQIEEMLMKLI